MDKPPFSIRQSARFSLADIGVKTLEAEAPTGRTNDGTLDYYASPEDWAVAKKIAERAEAMHMQYTGTAPDKVLILQDIMTAHCNASPIKLLQLLMSSDDDFSHDVFGIPVHMDRNTGRMYHEWKMRFAMERQ